MKLDKLDAVELDREDETVTSRTARLKHRISSKISKVVNRRQQQNNNNQNHGDDNEEEESSRNGDGEEEEKIPSFPSPPPSRADAEKDFRKGSFSYLNLLDATSGGDGAFPHRTQPIQDGRRARRRSSSGDPSKSASVEYLNQTKTSDFMARSNPIGLAEPKVRRDGYAVGKDGSFYRSSEHIFAERRYSSVDSTTAATNGSVRVQSERRASTSSLVTYTSSSSSSNNGIGFRHGSGIIATGRRQSNPFSFCMPFGNPNMGANNNGNLKTVRKYSKKTTSTGSSVKTSSNSSVTSTSSSASSSLNNTAVQSFIQKGIREMENLTQAADKQNKSDDKSGKKLSMTASATLESCFQAVDVSVRSSLAQPPIKAKDQAGENQSVNFTLSRPESRARSHVAAAPISLPEQQVTISLPASRRVSRQPSVDRELGAAGTSRGRRRQRRASVEVFNATYEMRLPSKKRAGSVTKISSNHVVYDKAADESGDQKVDTALTKDDVGDGEMGRQQTAAKGKEEEESGESLTGERGEGHGVSQNGVDEGKPSQKAEDESGRANEAANAVTAKNQEGVGDALKGLSAALESLQEQQKRQKATLISSGANKNNNKRAKGGSKTASATVSLRSSRRNSRACSPDRASSAGSGFRSRRNSMDLYTADVDIKLKSAKRGGSVESLTERSTCHIRCDDDTLQDLRLCARCHSPDHRVEHCQEFGKLKCPRCLDWQHWEDTCPARDDGEGRDDCKICHRKGHSNLIHTAVDYQQRRMIVDTLGWEPFRDWFYEGEFRSWWQLNGCIGVPLYKIYKRNTEWRKEVAPLTEDEQNNNDIYNVKRTPSRGTSVVDDNSTTAATTATTSRTRRTGGSGSIVDDIIANSNGNSNINGEYRIPIPPPMPKRNYALEKDDSIDELVKSITAPRKRVEINDNDSIDSGRSTPEHLKKYGGSADVADDDDEDEDGNDGGENQDGNNKSNNNCKRKGRTFSETLKMLDDDILAELDVN